MVYSRLGTKIARTLFIGAFLPFLGAGFLLYMHVKSMVTTMVHHTMDQLLSEVGVEIDTVMHSSLLHIIALAKNPIIQTPSRSTYEKLHEMWKVQSYYQIFDDITLIRPDGIVAASTTYNYRGTWKSKLWFKEALMGKTSLSPLQVIPHPFRVVWAASTPVVLKDEHITGVLVGQVGLEALWSITDRIHIGKTGYIVILDKYGNVIAHPDKTKIMHKLPFIEKYLHAISEDRTIVFEFGSEQQKKICALRPLSGVKSYKGQGWSIGIIQDVSEVFSIAHTMKTFIVYVAVGVFIVMALIAIGMSYLIVKPILQVTRATQHITQDNWDVHVNAKTNDEIGDLGDAFNRMSDHLRKTMISRDRLVAVIQERVRISKALEASEQRFRKLFHDAQDVIVLVDLETGGIIDGNHAAEERLGYLHEELVRMPFYQLVVAQHESRVWDTITRHREGEDHSRFEAEYALKKGGVIPVEISTTVMESDGKKIVQAIARDIAERKKTEEAIYRARAELQLMIDSMPFGVLLVDEYKCIRHINNAGLRMIKYPHKAAVLGKRCHEIMCPRDKNDCPAIDRNNYLDCVESEIMSAQKERIPVLKSVIPLTIEDEQLYLETFIDISERKKAEVELRKAKIAAETANKLKSQFVTNISHEIRTPLNGIIGYAELIQSTQHIPDAQKKAEAILRESEVLLQLINEILDHAKLEAGKMDLTYQPMRPQALALRLRDTISVLADKKGLIYQELIDERLPKCVVGDEFRLYQVLLNLLGNAVKFTERGKVTFAMQVLSQEESEVKILFVVQDTGMGIPKERQDDVFKSFQQVDGTLARRFGGTGLGATIAQRLVNLMGSAITVQSEPGKGSSFSFILKLEIRDVHVCEVPELFTEDQSVGGNGIVHSGTILLAEDYPANQEIAKMHLEKAGYRVIVAENGKAAVEACRDTNFDLILMDLQMPEMDGYSATMQIRNQFPHYEKVPIIAMTANAHATIRSACSDIGMNDVITKPIRRVEFLQTVARHMKSEKIASSEEEKKSDLNAEEKREPAQAEKPFNYEQILEEFSGNAVLVNTALKQLVKTIEMQLPHMTKALAENDCAVLRREAHKIRGGAANMTAMTLSKAAEEIEIAAEQNIREGMEEKIKVLHVSFQNYKEAVMKLT